MLTFSLINPEDISTILIPLAQKIWQENYVGIISEIQIKYMLAKMYAENLVKAQLKDGVQWYFLMLEDKAVGFVSFYKSNDKKFVFLSKLYLDSSQQGNGFGKKALEFVVSYTAKNNCNRVQLTVNRNNTKGIRAYQNFGFKKVKEQITDFGEGFVMDDFIFEYQV